MLKGDPAKVALDGVTGHIALEGGTRTFTRTPLPVEVDGGKLIPIPPRSTAATPAANLAPQ
jgi:hypothetical protein